jgi:hypothetical protein
MKKVNMIELLKAVFLTGLFFALPIIAQAQTKPSGEINLTLDETMKYIQNKIAEYGHSEGYRIKASAKLENKGCNVTYRRETFYVHTEEEKSNGLKGKSSVIYEFSLKDLDINSIYVLSSYLRPYTTLNKKLVQFKSTSVIGEYFESKTDSVTIAFTGGEEIGDRIKNAFRHAIRLCGGGKEDNDPFKNN